MSSETSTARAHSSNSQSAQVTVDQHRKPRRSRLGAAVLGLSLLGVGGVVGYAGQQVIPLSIASTLSAGAVAQSEREAQPSDATLMAESIKAVERVMPQASVVGVSPGPAQTTKVVLQVPGTEGMQPVYVLSDGETVVSGVVLDPMTASNAHDSAPASDERESGSADAGARENATQKPEPAAIQGFEVDAQGNPVGDPRPGLPEGVSATENSERAKSDGASIPAPASDPVSASSTPITSDKSDDPQGVAPDDSPRSADSKAADNSEQSVPAPASSPQESPELVIGGIDSLVGSEPFGNAVRTMLSGDPDIDQVRQAQGADAQQDAYFGMIQSLPAITQGEGPRHVYVMFDPNCPVCHRYYRDVYEDIQRGRVTVHWIPAVVFPDKRSSLSVSAIVMAEAETDAVGGAEMLHKVMTQRGYMDELDSSDRVDDVTPYLESVVKNTAVMAMARPETPLIVYKDRNDGLTIETGMPTGGYIGKIKVEDAGQASN